MLMIKSNFNRFIACVLVVMVFIGFSSSVMASTTAEEELSSAYTHLSEDDGDDGVYATLRKIVNVLTIFAFMICVFKLAQIGFKFMFGVANKRSDAMQSLLPWGIGVFICTMWLVVGNWIMGMLTDTGVTPDGPFDLPGFLNIFTGII